MDIETFLFRNGIGSWLTDIVTEVPAKADFQIGKNLPTDMGFIYGLNTYADGIGADGVTLPTSTQCMNMYLNLQDGSTEFYESLRLDDMLNVINGSPVTREKPYLQVSIPAFDLSKSSYVNPNLYTNFNIHLKIRYIQLDTWHKLSPNLKIEVYKSASKGK